MKNLDAPRRTTNYGRLTTGLIAAWFIFVLFLSAFHGFKNDANRIGLAVAAAALIPLVVFSLWFAASEKFRQFCLSLNPQILDTGTNLENPRIHLRPPGGSQRSTRNICIARGIRRHGHWIDGYTRGMEAGRSQSSQQFYSLAGTRHHGPGDSSKCGHHRPSSEPAQPFDGRDDGAASKLGSNVSGAVIFYLSRDLHRPGKGLESGFWQPDRLGFAQVYCGLTRWSHPVVAQFGELHDAGVILSDFSPSQAQDDSSGKVKIRAEPLLGI